VIDDDVGFPANHVCGNCKLAWEHRGCVYSGLAVRSLCPKCDTTYEIRYENEDWWYVYSADDFEQLIHETIRGKHNEKASL